MRKNGTLHKHKKKIHYMANFFLILLSLLFLFSAIFAIWVSSFKIPDLKSFNERRVSESTKIYDRKGEVVLYDLFQGAKRTQVKYTEISDKVKKATVAVEDDQFFNHKGVRPTAILRAVYANIFGGGYTQGGSTITQQVVKNTLLTGDKTITRKIKEWVLSLKLETLISKEEILEKYLNEISYGGNIYGVEEASRAFFGVNAKNISLAEAAYLAAIPQAPTLYSPYGKNFKKLEQRKNFVLSKMLEQKLISQKEYSEAISETVVFEERQKTAIKAPHFVMLVKEYLENKYGEKAIYENGYKVITTLDYGMQQIGEETVKKFAEQNKVQFNASNASLVAIDPKTGQILTMVGSKDYFAKDIDGNFNIATAKRQPGSAFKPFAYAAAFAKGFTPETVLFDVKTEFSLECQPDGSTTTPSQKCYSPQNYDGRFRGPITMKSALAQSINIPAVKTMYLAGFSNVLKLAREMGISGLDDIGRYGFTLVLGGGEVSLLDMTSSYGVFANNGVRNPYSYILSVSDKNGNILESYEQNPISILNPNIAAQISSILSDNNLRAPVFGYNSFLNVRNRRDVAVKTGTTNSYKDVWIVGYTPSIVVGSWAGNNDNTSMEKKVAGAVIAPMWNSFMQQILKDHPEESFLPPEEIDKETLPPVLKGIWQGNNVYSIDKVSGKLATDLTPDETKEDIVINNVHTILNWIDKDSPRENIKIENPEKDPQYEYWEYGVQKWLKDQNIIQNTTTLITEYDNIHTEENKPIIRSIYPVDGSAIKENGKIVITLDVSTKFGYKKAVYFINGSYIGESSVIPDFRFTKSIKEIDNLEDLNEIKAIFYDSVYNKAYASTTFVVE